MINYKKYLKEGSETVADAIKDAESKEEVKDLQKAATVVGKNAEVADVYSDDSGEIEQILNRSLKRALIMKKQDIRKGFPNVLLIGEAGTGKTERVKAWAQKHNIYVLEKNATDLDELDMGGVVMGNLEKGIGVRLPMGEFDDLDDTPNSILFLDELNRAPTSVVGTMLKLVDEHTVTDMTAKGGKRYLKNFLFTVAAINPADDEYDTNKLDTAMTDRFLPVDVVIELDQFKGYMTHKINKALNFAKNEGDEEEIKACEGRLRLLNTLIDDKSFKFDTKKDIRDSKDRGNGQILNPRSLDYAIINCDGTKDDFLFLFKRKCNSLKYDMVKTILDNYKDVDDKANDALKDEPIFKKKKSAIDDLKDFMNAHKAN